MIPFTEFSKEGEVLHFAHANGYPVGCYSSFLKTFQDNYRVIGMHARPLWESNEASSFSSWKKFAEDYTDFSKEQSLEGIVGMGHSMGAISSLIAAYNNPKLFKRLILLDPVIPPPQYGILSLLPFAISKRINPMVKVAMRRRNEWSDKEEAFKYFKSKRTYQRFSQQSFDDFLDYGVEEVNGSFRLKYPRELEAKVYSSVPSVWSILKNPPCPLIIVRAEFSDVIVDKVWDIIIDVGKNTTLIYMKKVGHMMPLEKPIQLAQLVKPFL